MACFGRKSDVLSVVFIRRVGWGCRLQWTLLTAIELALGAVSFSITSRAAAPLVLPGLRKLAIWLGAIAKSKLVMVAIRLKCPAMLAMVILLVLWLNDGAGLGSTILPLISVDWGL